MSGSGYQARADGTRVPVKSVAARIEARIHVIRGERVMLDVDLAALYGVETGALNLAVRGIEAVFRTISCSS
ncbi:MAG TPA: ORF6N domain-containing protein [Candidatus Limnocylindria bacterium]|nr:ORF6N domain-containing protein [Candidatus Limnocylindria bacterium]